MAHVLIRDTSKFTAESGSSTVWAITRPLGDQPGWRSPSGLVVRRRTRLPSGLRQLA